MNEDVEGDEIRWSIRMPKDLHEQYVKRAKSNRRSLNAEIVFILDQVLGEDNAAPEEDKHIDTPDESAWPTTKRGSAEQQASRVGEKHRSTAKGANKKIK